VYDGIPNTKLTPHRLFQ